MRHKLLKIAQLENVVALYTVATFAPGAISIYVISYMIKEALIISVCSFVSLRCFKQLTWLQLGFVMVLIRVTSAGFCHGVDLHHFSWVLS